MTSREDMEAVIESILFVAHDPVSRKRLAEAFGERQREQAMEAVDAVVRRYREQDGRGVMIDEVAGGLRFVTRPDLHGYLKRFFEVSSKSKLTMPALETLAIIAYRQPITAPEVAELRNVGSTGVVKKLLERRLIRIAGRKEVVGKPFLYATTREFLMHFGLRSLKELPPLEQFEELFGDELDVAPENLEPDAEEIVDREAAEVAEAEDEAADRQEADEIEEERAAAEEAQEAQEVQGTEASDEEEPDEEASDVSDEEASDASDALGEEAPDEEVSDEEASDASDALGEEASDEEVSDEEASDASDASDEGAPVEEAPDEEAPDEEASDVSDEEAPVEEAPVEEAPDEEAPAEEALDQDEVSVAESLPESVEEAKA